MHKNFTRVWRDELSGETYTEIKHPSGVTVYVYPKKLSIAYAMFTARYGSLERTFYTAEENKITVPDGVAHFLEHKLFEEEDGSDVFERFAALGASANAFTSNEMTSYLFSTTGSPYEPLKELLSFVMHPYFTEENVKKEIGIIGQEIDMYEDQPSSRLVQATLEGLYRHHNVRVNIAGTKETISYITPEILYRCYHTFYHPSNMILTVVGDVDAERVIEVADEVLGTEEKKGHTIFCEYPDEDEEIEKEYTVFSMQISKPQLSFSFKDLEKFETSIEKQRHAYAVNILLKILFSRSSCFYNELYRKGLINDAFHAIYEWMESCAHVMLICESDEPDKVFAEIESLLESISEEMISKDDFMRVQRAMYAESIKMLDSTEEIAYNITDAAIHGIGLWNAGEAIRSVSFEQIKHLAKTYFKDKRFVRVVIEPSER